MEIIHERIDDVPLIISYLIKNKVITIVDEHLKNHGNQNILSNGEVTVIWLAYILSQGDHRKAHVADWVSQHQIILSACIGKQVNVNNFTDDRLTRLLFRYSLDECWNLVERDLAKITLALIPVEHFLEPYFENNALDVIKGVFKLDGTSITGYHEVSEDGLMQYGFSKDHRPDLAQIKLMSCVEGLSGCPIRSEIDCGNKNDDSMYEPILDRMRETFSTNGFLYCGDSKMSLNKIRKNIVTNREFYLCPLELSNSKTKKAFKEEWITDAVNGSKQIINIFDNDKIIAYGYEFERLEQDSKGDLQWHERVLVIKSLGYFESEKKRFDKSLTKIKDEISKLSSKLCKDLEEAKKHLETSIEGKFNKLENLKDFFEIEYEMKEIVKTYNRTELRKGVTKREGSYDIKRYKLCVKKIIISEQKREEYLSKIGWRPFVTNVPKNLLSFANAYSYYRKTQYVIESGFHMLKADPVGIRPLFVWRDDQIKGLIRFLGLGVHFQKIMSLELMIALRKNNEEIMGLTAGQPKRKTPTPTAISVLSYFSRSGINFSGIKINNVWENIISPLPEVCLKILNLLGLNEDTYEKLKIWQIQNKGLEN